MTQFIELTLGGGVKKLININEIASITSAGGDTDVVFVKNNSFESNGAVEVQESYEELKAKLVQ